MDVPKHAELAVVGAGPGGYTAAIRAGQLGLDSVLIEREGYGGVCLNHGCIPSKALIAAAGRAHRARTADGMGIHADPEVRLDELGAWVGEVVDRLTGGVKKLCKANGVTLVEGTAAFASSGKLRIAECKRTDGREGADGDGSGDPATMTLDAAVVATGSRPVEIPGFGFGAEPVLSSRELLSLDALPDRLAVVGAGYVGMELATALAKLGVEVTMIEALEEALPGFGTDLARPARRRAADLGVEFHFGQAAEHWTEAGDGIEVIATDGDGTEHAHAADAVLVAVGREPVTETVDPAAAGLDPDSGGILPTDDRCRTDVEGIYAVGDVAGEPMLAHKAGREAAVAVSDVAEGGTDERVGAVPAVAYTDPEVATVGLTAAAAEGADQEVEIGEFPFRASGRALTLDDAEGFVRLVADAESGAVLGAEAVGTEVAELAGELALIVETGATVEAVARTIHAHPTLAEAVMEAAENAQGRAIHTLNR
jgi:dihydrolipoamide dehydrogenase